MIFERYIGYSEPVVKKVNESVYIAIYEPISQDKTNKSNMVTIYNSISDSYIDLYYTTYNIIYNILNTSIMLPKIKNKKVSKRKISKKEVDLE